MRKLYALFVLAFLFSTQVSADETLDAFLGKWALYLPGGAGWLEVSNDKGYLDAEMLWYGGSVVPVSHVYLDGETLVVTRVNEQIKEKDEDGNTERLHLRTQLFKFMFYGDQLVGKHISPAGNGLSTDIRTFTAEKIPPVPPAPDLSELKYGEPITLFNGRNLDGWELLNENAVNGWMVKDGTLVNNPVQKEGEPHIHYGNLRTVQEFEDFNLKLQVNVPKGSNSGIYLRGIYEIQVADTYGRNLDSHNMGAIYSRITPTVSAEKPAGEWQSFDITLVDRHVTVILNGTTIIDNQPLYGVTGGAITADQFSPGPIYLQGDHGKVSYRNMVLAPVIE